MAEAVNVIGDVPGKEAIIDLAVRTAISRKYPFSPVHEEHLSQYLLRLPVTRLQDGAKLEHIMELFEHCQAKYKDPLLKKLAEADRLFFGINVRHERKEKQARKLYEELSGDLFEAQAMCMAIYNSEVGRLYQDGNPKHKTYYRLLVDGSITQLVNGKFSPIGLFNIDVLGNSRELPAIARQKLRSATQLREKIFPILVVYDKTEKIIPCTRCKGHFFEKFAFNCGFFKAPFCSPECMMVRFSLVSVNEENKKELFTELIPDLEVLLSLAARAKAETLPIYLDQPERIPAFFKINSLLGTERRISQFKKLFADEPRACRL